MPNGGPLAISRNRLALSGWCVAVLLLAVPLVFRLSVLVARSESGPREVIDFIFDDGYYYLAIAANLADTGHSTLDGLTATNGYQPLWLLVLTALGRIVGTRGWTFFVASCALMYAIAICTPLIALSKRRGPCGPAALALGAALAFVLIQQSKVFLEGLEPILIPPLAIPLVLLLEGPTGTRQTMLLSLVLAAMFLVRLDALALTGASFVVLALARPTPGSPPAAQAPVRWLRLAALLAVAVVPVVLGYLLANLWLFDSAVPVSGVAKMIGGAKFNNWGVAAEFLGRWKTQLLALAILLPLEIAARRLKRADGLFYRSAAVAALAALAQYLYYAAFSTWSIQPWYTYLVALERAIILARILYLAAAIGEVPRWRILGFACAAAVGAWMLYRALLWTEQSLPPDAEARAHPLNALLAGVVKREPQPSFNQISIDMLGDFFPDRGRAPTLIAMGDRSGGLAYWGRDRLAVVQLEGLTLDPNYIRARVGGEGAEYLERRYPIEYLVVDREFIPMVPGPQQEPEYVVAEPIQGRVTTAMVPTFCFPKSAVRYRQAYPTPAGTNTRWAFAFAERVACTSQALELVRNAAASGGLRRLSLPGEFGP